MKRLLIAIVAALLFAGCTVQESEILWYLRMATAYCEGDMDAGKAILEAGYELPSCR